MYFNCNCCPTESETMRLRIVSRPLKFSAFLAAFWLAQTFGVGVWAQEKQTVPADWREQYAYTLGMQAYIFSFPWSYLPELRYTWVTQKPSNASTPYAPLNHFWHLRQLADASYRDGGSPNYDTLYSIAWLDVSKEPVILSHSDVGDRYFTFEIASMTSDNFAYVGSRTTGSKAGHFAIIGPGWKGDLPKGVKRLEPSPTAAVLIFGRTAVTGPEDVPAVKKLQDQYKLTPLSLWGKSGAQMPERRDVFKPFNRKKDPLNEWRTINRAMTENPPLERNKFMVELMKNIGVGPGQDVDAMDEPTRRGLAQAAKDGRALLFNVTTSGYGKIVNGWTYPPTTIGRAGYRGDFLTRGAVQCMGGIIANDPEEAIYINTTTDVKGERLSGANRYVLKFEKGRLPEVSQFWSLTMYDMTFNFTDNAINRYAIGSLKKNYKLSEDGSLTIYIQHDSPGRDKEANWLPSPKDNFFVVFRTYGPGKELLAQKWKMPGLRRVEN